MSLSVSWFQEWRGACGIQSDRVFTFSLVDWLRYEAREEEHSFKRLARSFSSYIRHEMVAYECVFFLCFWASDGKFDKGQHVLAYSL